MKDIFSLPHNRLRFYAFLMFLGVVLGAFGAHGVKNTISPLRFETYQTGVTYWYLHSIGLFIIELIEVKFPPQNLFLPKLLAVLGILLFSGNCLLYAMTGVKFFAMLVPIGGASFLAAWLCFIFKLKKLTL